MRKQLPAGWDTSLAGQSIYLAYGIILGPVQSLS